MTRTDVVSHYGVTYRMGNLADALPDEIREEVHSAFDGGEGNYQGFWDLLVEMHPVEADLAALACEPVVTVWQKMQDCNDLQWTIEGGVVRVLDGQVTWYANEDDWNEAAEWADKACIVHDYEHHQWYDAFCGECPGMVDGGPESRPLVARYAAAKFDMTSEEGREEALEQLFGGDEDALAEACMLIDMASDAEAM